MTEIKLFIVLAMMAASFVYIATELMMHYFICIMNIISTILICIGLRSLYRGIIEDDPQIIKNGIGYLGAIAYWSIYSGSLAIYGEYTKLLEGYTVRNLFIYQFLFGSLYVIIYISYIVVLHYNRKSIMTIKKEKYADNDTKE